MEGGASAAAAAAAAAGNDMTSTIAAAEETSGLAAAEEKGPVVNFTLHYNKKRFQIEWPWDGKIRQLRTRISELTGVPIPLQKLMVKGALATKNHRFV